MVLLLFSHQYIQTDVLAVLVTVRVLTVNNVARIDGIHATARWPRPWFYTSLGRDEDWRVGLVFGGVGHGFIV